MRVGWVGSKTQIKNGEGLGRLTTENKGGGVNFFYVYMVQKYSPSLVAKYKKCATI